MIRTLDYNLYLDLFFLRKLFMKFSMTVLIPRSSSAQRILNLCQSSLSTFKEVGFLSPSCLSVVLLGIPLKRCKELFNTFYLKRCSLTYIKNYVVLLLKSYPLLERTNMKTNQISRVSPSTLAIYNECKTCFFEHMNGRKRPASIFPSLPGGMDRIFKALFDEHRRLGTLPPEINSLGSAKLYPDQTKLDEWRNPWRGLRWNTPEGTLQGAVDDILEINGLLTPLDFKTRSSPPKPETIDYYRLQISLYALLLEKTGHPINSVGYLLFYYPTKAGNNGLITFQTTLVEVNVDLTKAENTFREALNLLKQPEPPLNPNCAYCKYKEVKP